MDKIIEKYPVFKIVKTLLTPETSNALTKPIANKIGETLADIWEGLIGYKIHYWKELKNHKYRLHYEENINQLLNNMHEKLTNVDDESLQEPEVSIAKAAIDIVDKGIYNPFCDDMIAKLLASSIDKQKCMLSHPRYAFIIDSMNELDYKILQDISTKSEIIGISLISNHSEQFIIDSQLLNSASIEAISLSISNLISLGLIQFKSYLFNKEYLFKENETDDYIEFVNHDEYFETDEGDSLRNFLKNY